MYEFKKGGRIQFTTIYSHTSSFFFIKQSHYMSNVIKYNLRKKFLITVINDGQFFKVTFKLSSVV